MRGSRVIAASPWRKAPPPGQDFPSAGAFNATPAEIYTLATAGARATADTTLQVNHIDSHFAPLQIDTSASGDFFDQLDDAGRAARRLPSTTDVPNLFHHFPALELWNGADRAQQVNFLTERIGIWFGHLNKGLRTTAISDTDTPAASSLRMPLTRPASSASGSVNRSMVGSGPGGRVVVSAPREPPTETRQPVLSAEGKRHGDWTALALDRSAEMRAWVEPLRERARSGAEVFAYFNDHYAGFAPDSARLFRACGRRRSDAGGRVSRPPRKVLRALVTRPRILLRLRRLGGLEVLGGSPVVFGNWVEVIPEGRRAFAAMLEAIAGAKRSVAIEMYIWADDRLGRRFAERLAAKAREGIPVRTLVDAFGSWEGTGMVLCGREDAATPVEVHREIAADIPNARLVIVDDCGHLSTLERPEALYRELRRWLNAG